MGGARSVRLRRRGAVRLTQSDPRALARSLADRTPIEVQEEVTHGDQTRTFLAVKFPLIDESGELYGVGGVPAARRKRPPAV